MSYFLLSLKCFSGFWFTSCWQMKLPWPIRQAPNWCLLLPAQQRWPYEPKSPPVDPCMRTVPMTPGQAGESNLSHRPSWIPCLWISLVLLYFLSPLPTPQSAASHLQRDLSSVLYLRSICMDGKAISMKSHVSLKIFLGWERLLWNLLVQNKLHCLHEDIGLTGFVKLYQKYIRFVLCKTMQITNVWLV